MTPEEFDRACASQQRSFDDRIAAFRENYLAFPDEQRASLKAWLEKAHALERENADRPMMLMVRTEIDVYGEDGKPVRWADNQFTAGTLLSAVSAWDAGEDFVPHTVLP